MHTHSTSLTLRIASIAAAAAVVTAGVAGVRCFATMASPPHAGSLLIAPMIGVIEPCIQAEAQPTQTSTKLARACGGPEGSAGVLVESTLRGLNPSGHVRAGYELGYTLPVPLLQLFKNGPGGWAIDQAMVERLVRTVHQVQRPMILYLFSTHFAADAPIEKELAKDPSNMAHTRDGALGVDAYYDSQLYNWTFASTANALTSRRQQAISAVLDAACRLDAKDRAKIHGVTLLGELHHLFPDFQTGMGFDGKYRITDYSKVSIQGFRQFLAQEFVSIQHLNRLIGSQYTSFDVVSPPSKDIRTEPLAQFTEHIDPFAHGSLPVSGWAYIPGASNEQPPSIHIYRNGRFAAKTLVNQGRQDVLAAMPQFGDANTGWRADLDFRQWPAGMHQLDIYLEATPGKLQHLGTRHVAVMDRQQSPTKVQPQQTLPRKGTATEGVQAHIDFPHEQSSYYYNPLASLWHAYRARQITAYLQHFNAQVGASCLSDVPRYTHQIIPFTNPSWDENKFAIRDSLRPHDQLRLGVSLYGDPTYGQGFFQWLARSNQPRYGITEFHPLKAMDSASVSKMLDQHARHGADFLSFFMEPEWEGQRVPRGHNMFSFDPRNTQFGSDVLYRSVQQALDSDSQP